MDPYISNKAIDSTYSIMTQVDLTSGRWPSKSIHNLCDIARRCLEVKQRERATIEDVRFIYHLMMFKKFTTDFS